MRSRAWETASQIALRTCSEEIGRGQYIHLAKGICAIKHTFEQKVAASHEEQMSPLMTLCFSRYEMREIGLMISSPENI